MPEIIKAGSIKLDKAQEAKQDPWGWDWKSGLRTPSFTPSAQVVEAGSIELDKPVTDGLPYGGVTSLSGYKSPSPGWLKSAFDTLGFIDDEQKGQKARASNVLGLAEEFNATPSRAERDYNALTNRVFTKDKLPDMGLRGSAETAMLVGVARLAMTHPIATLISIPAFMGLNALYTGILERQHGVPGEGATGFLPETTIQPVKDVVWLAETIAQAYAVSPLFKLGKGLDAKYTEPLKKAVTEKWFKDITETFKMPERIYVSANKIRNYFGGGQTGETITPKEYAILQEFGIPRESYRSAIKHGLDIEIPSEKIITSADKPWWNEVKNIFRLTPEWEPPVETTILGGGKATMRTHVSGLLEKPEGVARRSFVDIFKDINRFMGDKGAIGDIKLTPEQLAARERLKADLEIIKKEAEQAGKDFGSYLKEVGFDEPSIAAAGEILGVSRHDEIKTTETVVTEPTPSELEPLAKEVRKYGSAEEFVGAQTTYIHETDAPIFNKFDIDKIGSGQGEAWLGRGIYLQEKGGFKLEKYGNNKVEASLMPNAKIFEIKDTPKGKFRDNFVEYAVDMGLDGGLANNRIKEGLSLKNLLPRDIFKINPNIVKQLKRDGFDGLLQDGELVIYNDKVLKTKSQLTDIYNQAKGATGFLPETTPKEEIKFAPEPISTEEPYDINTLLEMASREGATKGELPEDPSYEQIRGKANSLAWEKINKKINLAERREKASLKKQVIEDVRENPVFQIMEYVAEKGGFNYDNLRETYSKDMVDELRKKRPGLVSKTGTFSLDVVVNESEGVFDDPDTLMMDMLNFKGIKASVEAFEITYKDMLSEVEFNDYAIDVLDAEISILNKLLKENAPKPAKGLKKFIREETGQLRVGELAVSEYGALKAGMKKAETASRIAYREGNKLGALTEKTRQREMAERLKARLLAKTETKKIHDGILKLSKNTKIPVDYQDQIALLLEDYDLLPRSPKGQRQVDSLRNFLDRAESEGEDVDIPRSLLDKVERYGRVHWKDLTLDQLRDIYDQAKMIEHLGTLKNKLLTMKGKRDFQTSVNSIVDTTKKNFNIDQETLDENLDNIIRESVINPAWYKKLLEFYDGAGAELVKPERMFRLMDKWEDLGTSWRELYLPIKESSDREIRIKSDYAAKIKAIFNKFDGYKWTKKTLIPGIKYPLSREAIVMTALNTGNEGNMDALRYGKRQWSDEQIQAIKDNLTPDEKELVTAIWDLIDSLYPLLAEVYLRKTGARLKKVEGNYFPLVFDATLSSVVDKIAMDNLNRDFFQTIYAIRPPNDSFTNKRTGGKYDPLLKFSVIFKHISDVIHYVTHAESTRDVHKLLLDPRVRSVMQSIPEIGDKGHKEIIYWLQDISKPKMDPLSFVDSFFDYARKGTQTAILATFSVAVTQLMQVNQTFLQLGFFNTLEGLARFYANPLKNVEEIKAMSAEMSVGWTYFDREMADTYNNLGLDEFYNLPWLKDFMFGIISALDMFIRYPTWMEAYRIGQTKFKNEKDLIEYADMETRNSQGVAFMKDLASIQRGGRLKKLITMFYTFPNTFHGILWELEKKWKYADGWKVPETIDLARAFFYLIMIPAIFDIIKRRKEWTLKNVGNEMAINWFSRYPLARDISRAIIDGYNYRTTPATAGIEATISFTQKPTFIGGVRAAGYWIPGGFPSEMAVIAMKGFMDLKAGKTNDFTRLFFREPAKKK